MKEDSKFLKFLFRYFFITNVESLSIKEKIGIVSPPIIFITVLLLWAYVDSNNWIALLLLGDAYVLFLGLCYPLFFYNKLKKQYDFHSTVRFGATYQSISKSLSYIAPGIIMIILSIGFIMDNLTMGSLISFAFILPFLALFLRIDVFNDNSSIEGDEIILGYHPTYYGFMSLILGVYGYLNVYSLLNYDINLAIILFCITVIFQIILLIPDKINKFLFFELRRKKGFFIYICSLVLIFLMISSIILNIPLINLNNFDLSLESIIKIIIYLGIGIILAFLIVKEFKKRKSE